MMNDTLGRPATRRALVLVEVALSLVLLVGAGLLLKSFARLQSVDPGFRADHRLSVRLSLPKSRYARRADLVAFHERLSPRLAMLPGVDAVGLSSVAPLTTWRATVNFSTDDRALQAGQETPLAQYRVVSPDFRATVGTPLLAGRDFTETDDGTSPSVVLVNRTLAERFWSGTSPIGKRIRFDDAGTPLREAEVVGIVGDVKHYSLSDPPTFDVYVPLRQVPENVVQWLANGTSWIVKTRTPPRDLVAAVREEVRRVDPEVAASTVRPLDETLAATLAPRRFNLLLVQMLALAALVLAATGLYAVTAQLVSGRRREIGIRLALGARRPQVLALVLSEAARIVALGLVVGAAGALAAGRVLRGVLFGVTPTDVPTFALVAVTLVAAALLASYVPARRAMAVDPVVALRVE
jgi:putative ABC transport system permease protein